MEENMKKMDTSYQTISRNFFKDLFTSKEEDVKFDLSVYTKQYSSIHSLYTRLPTGLYLFIILFSNKILLVKGNVLNINRGINISVMVFTTNGAYPFPIRQLQVFVDAATFMT